MVAHAIVMCLSVTSRNSIKMVEYIELVLGVEASFDLSCGNSSGLENTSALPSGVWNFVPNSGFEQFRHRKSTVLSKLVDGRAC